MLRIKLEIMSNNSIFCLGIHKFVVEIEKNAWKDEHKIKNASFLRAVGKGFLGGSVVKNPPANAGDVGSIPGSGRSPGGGNGNLLQYSGLENPWTEEPGGLQSVKLQKLSEETTTKDSGTGKEEDTVRVSAWGMSIELSIVYFLKRKVGRYTSTF